MEEHITGQVISHREERGISWLAGVTMDTDMGRDVIMPRLIQTWQAPITPPLETEQAGVKRQRKEREGEAGGHRRGVKMFKTFIFLYLGAPADRLWICEAADTMAPC